MSKFWKILVGIIILLFIALLIVWNSIPSWVSTKLTDMAKVSVSVRDIQFSFSHIKAKGIRVGNPPNTNLHDALKIKLLDIKAPVSNFFKDDVVIDEITLKDIYFGIELNSLNDTRGNWTTIADNFNESMKQEELKPKKDEKKKSLLIKKLVLINLRIEVYTKNDGKLRKLQTIPRLEFNNVGSEGGYPTAQIANIIIQELTQKVIKERLNQFMRDLVDPSKVLENPVKKLRGLFGMGAFVEEFVSGDSKKPTP